MMKKILTILTALLFVMTAALAEETLLDKVIRVAEDEKDLIRMGEDDLFDLIGIEPDEYTDFAYLASRDSLSGREVIVLRATDETAARDMAEKLEEYRQYRMHMTRNYPDQADAYRLLSKAEVLQEDLLVVLSVGAPDPQEASLLLQEE